MPKFEPPPRRARNRDGEEEEVTVLMVPLGSTRVKDRTLSQAQPWRRERKEIPPRRC